MNDQKIYSHNVYYWFDAMTSAIFVRSQRFQLQNWRIDAEVKQLARNGVIDRNDHIHEVAGRLADRPGSGRPTDMRAENQKVNVYSMHVPCAKFTRNSWTVDQCTLGVWVDDMFVCMRARARVRVLVSISAVPESNCKWICAFCFENIQAAEVDRPMVWLMKGDNSTHAHCACLISFGSKERDTHTHVCATQHIARAHTFQNTKRI